jgi:hypothetical protein
LNRKDSNNTTLCWQTNIFHIQNPAESNAAAGKNYFDTAVGKVLLFYDRIKILFYPFIGFINLAIKK